MPAQRRTSTLLCTLDPSVLRRWTTTQALVGSLQTAEQQHRRQQQQHQQQLLQVLKPKLPLDHRALHHRRRRKFERLSRLQRRVAIQERTSQLQSRLPPTGTAGA